MENNEKNFLNIFDDVSPNEIKLKDLIESRIVSVLVAIGSNKNADYKIIWEILHCYCHFINGHIRFFIYSKEDLNKDFLEDVIYHYSLEPFVKFINNDEKSDFLSTLLGCDMALISKKTTEEELKMLCHFGLPILSLDNKLNEINEDNLCFYTTRETENVASYINVIGNNVEYKDKMIKKSLEFI